MEAPTECSDRVISGTNDSDYSALASLGSASPDPQPFPSLRAVPVGTNAKIAKDGRNGLIFDAEAPSSLSDSKSRLPRVPPLSACLGPNAYFRQTCLVQNRRTFVLHGFSFIRLIETSDQFDTVLLQARGLQ